MVSAPAPVVMMFAPLEPVTLRAVVKTLALIFSKLATSTESPVVWSTPGATERLIAVVPPEASKIRLFMPAPPSSETSDP